MFCSMFSYLLLLLSFCMSNRVSLFCLSPPLFVFTRSSSLVMNLQVQSLIQIFLYSLYRKMCLLRSLLLYCFIFNSLSLSIFLCLFFPLGERSQNSRSACNACDTSLDLPSYLWILGDHRQELTLLLSHLIRLIISRSHLSKRKTICLKRT